jgi:arylsulfate sulfotransferase
LSTLDPVKEKSREKYLEASAMPARRNGGWLSNLQRHLLRCTGITCLILSAAGCGSSVMPTPSGAPSPPRAPPAPQQMGTVTISPQNGALSTGQTLQFAATDTGGGTIAWSVNGIAGGNSTVGTVDTAGNYTAPAISHSINAIVQAAAGAAPQTNFATAIVALIQSGQVQATANPQVALYSMYLPQPGTVTVQFGTDTSYGMRTWAKPTPSIPVNYGGQVNLQVAGMRGSTNYHLQALVKLASGVTYKDSDHPFATGIPPLTSSLQITTSGGSPPQPGIQLFDTVQFGATSYNPNLAQAFATDLQGNVIWTYSYVSSPANVITPIKPLPNGHFLLVLTVTSGPTNSTIPAGTANDVREIDLVGNTIHDLPMAALNQSLADNGFMSLHLFAFSRDVLALPNGHYVFLAQMAKDVSNIAGYSGEMNIAGDVLIDVDQNYKPDWVWNSFDHLDINHHPYQFPPDWTHSDALLYSADDHDLLLSIRNQNWVIKIDYQDAMGSGNIVWRLGEGGDFKLIGGVDPTDWFYAQHGMNFFSPNTSGLFQLGLIDDGDDRQFPQGVNCGTAGAPVCDYSTVPVLLVDESAMTATLLHHYVAPAAFYSFFGGQADLLPNGDIEVDFASAKSGATVQEYQPGTAVVETAPQIVWQAVSPGYDQYRAMRLPSLYPGVQW